MHSYVAVTRVVFLRASTGRVPYDVAKDKETRNVFRRFMAAFPEKFNYNEARVSPDVLVFYFMKRIDLVED